MPHHRHRPVDLPGQRVERIGETVVLTGRPAGARGRETCDEAPAEFRFPLSIPGEVALNEVSCVVSVQAADNVEASGAETRAIVGSSTVAYVRRDLCRGPLSVRNRRPGDRFRPAELGREKKLQDFFVDKKVARHGRDRVPLVVDGTGRILWVAGYTIDAGFRVTDPAQGVLVLRLRQLGGSA